MSKKVFMILFFGCLGMTTEIFFVAFTNLLNQTPLWDEPLASLTGKTYVWMFPIYALIPIIAAPVFGLAKKYPVLLRTFFYAVLILIVEFITGFLLDQITGKCPWDYTTGWHIMGYIRLDYTPIWMVFGFMLEYLYNFLDTNLKLTSS